jgi:dTDP-4-dehydrorhamnose reductase
MHFSTDYVFDGSGTRARRETDRTSPLSVYGASKLAGEEQIRAAGAPALILRTSWVYAAQGANFLCKIAELAQTKAKLRVVADQVGAPTSAALIAEVVARLIGGGLTDLCDKTRKTGGTVHLAASGETTWFDFAIEIVAGLRSRGVPLDVQNIIPIDTIDFHTPARRPLNSRLDLSLLQSVFGITMPNWREALDPELNQLARDLLADLY